MMRAAGVLRLREWLLVAAALLVGCGALNAQSFTVEQILSAPFPSQLTAAETGARVAWVFNLKGAQNVWVADGSRFEPRQVTHYMGDTGQPLASLRITPDGKTLVYARGTEINGDGRAANPTTETQQPKQQAWAIDVEGGHEPRLLGDMGCAFEGCEDIEISPDGKWVVWETKQQLSIAPTSGASAAKPLTDLRGSMSSPRWSPEAKRLLFPERTQSWSIWIGDSRTYKSRELWKSGKASRDSLPHFATESLQFAAGNRVVFDSEADGWNHLYSIAASGGTATLLTPGEFDVEDVDLSSDKKMVLYSSNQNDADRRHLWRVDAAGGVAPVALTSGETIEWGAVETGDGKNILCLGSTATSPAQVYRVSSGGRELLAKNLLPADFPSSQLVIPQQVIFQSEDGLMIHGQLFVPKNAKQRNPGLIFTHGGPSRQMLLGFHYLEYYLNEIGGVH